MPDVITIGEILGDFIPEKNFYVLRPGGAVSNVAVNLSRLKIKTGIIAKIGDDFLGNYLLDFLRENNVDIKYVYKTKKYKTGLVFVFLDKNKERDFSFYGAPSADQFLEKKEISEKYITTCKILHFGSISMIGYKSRCATLKAIKIAKRKGKIVSYDPNVRLNLADNIEEFKNNIKKYFKYADIIKLSEEELKFLFDLDVEKLKNRKFLGNKIIFISCGKKGCYVKYKNIFEYVKGYKVKVVDTTGAGDAFVAGIIYGFLNTPIFKQKQNFRKNFYKKHFSKKELLKIAQFANKMGAKAVKRKGAV